MADRLTSEQVSGRLVWTLSLAYAGEVYRWSSEPFAVVDADGRTLAFDGGLNPIEFEDIFAGADGEADDVSIPFELIFPVDVALLEARGHSLSSATAEVAIYAAGGAWEDRRVVIANGRIVEPYFGGVDEPIGFSVEALPYTDKNSIVPAGARFDETKFSPFTSGSKSYAYNDDDRSEVLGLYYPVVFGTPGWRKRAPVEATTSGSQGQIVWWSISATTFTAEHNYILIAGHHVGASTVKVVWSNSNTDGVAVINTTDNAGNKVALCFLGDDTAADSIGDADEYWIIWDDVGGGLQKTDGAGCLELAGDVCEYFLALSSLDVDRGAWAAARPYLNRYRLAGYIDEPVTPWEWLSDNVFPLLPIDIRSGPNGLYPVVWRIDARANECVGAPLVEGRNVTRLGPVTESSAESIVNDVRIDYSLRVRTGKYKDIIQVNGNPTTGSNERLNLFAALSEQLYGRQSTTIQTDVLYDEPTAGLIAGWILAAKAFPTRKVKYEAGAELGYLAPGDPVLLTDESLHIADRVALVHSIAWESEEALTITLWLHENPPRDDAATT